MQSIGRWVPGHHIPGLLATEDLVLHFAARPIILREREDRGTLWMDANHLLHGSWRAAVLLILVSL